MNNLNSFKLIWTEIKNDVKQCMNWLVSHIVLKTSYQIILGLIRFISEHSNLKILFQNFVGIFILAAALDITYLQFVIKL